METLNYADLFTVPYKRRGRTLNGLDCYGLCIELYTRLGIKLNDVLTSFPNLTEIEEPEKYCMIENDSNNTDYHVMFYIDDMTILSMESNGLKIKNLKAVRNCRYYRVIHDSKNI